MAVQISGQLKFSIKYSAVENDESTSRVISGLNLGVAAGSDPVNGVNRVTAIGNLFDTFSKFSNGGFNNIRLSTEQEVIL